MQNASSAIARNANGDSGFIRSIDPVAARRQFRVSIGLMAILGVATLASAMTLCVPPATQRVAAGPTVKAPQMIHVRHAGGFNGNGG